MIADSSSEARNSRVFVSYVHDNQDVVDRLAKELSAYGIKVWLDKSDLKPGYRSKDAIREAISEGDFFVACFSESYEKRSKSYMNEELTLAIEELRQRPTERAWFIFPSSPFSVALTRAVEQRPGADLRFGAVKPRLHFGRSARGPVGRGKNEHQRNSKQS